MPAVALTEECHAVGYGKEGASCQFLLQPSLDTLQTSQCQEGMGLGMSLSVTHSIIAQNITLLIERISQDITLLIELILMYIF